jgi:hypothetical protein
MNAELGCSFIENHDIDRIIAGDMCTPSIGTVF